MLSNVMISDIFRSIKNGYFTLDREWRFAYINSSIIVDREPKEVIGKIIWEELPGLIGTDIETAYRKAMEIQVDQWVNMKSVLTGNSYNIFIHPEAYGISVHWQELALTKDELARRATDKYLMLFNLIDEGFCIIDMIFDNKGKPVDYRFIEINPAFEKQTGLCNSVGKLISDLLPDNEEYWFEIYGKVALTGEPIRYANEVKDLNRWYDVYAFKIDSEDVGNVGVLFKDITEDVKLKKELEKNLKIQDEIFTNVSHELKTPLNVIFSTTQLLEFYLENNLMEYNNEKVCKKLNIIKQNCYRFTKLINNIVDLSKMDSGYFKLKLINENIVQVIENIVQSVSEYVKAKDLSIIFDTDIEEKIIACDPEKIERIILNLISNAIKFSNPGNEICVNIADKGDFVEISVKDAGMGIEEKYLESVFIRFHQIDKTLSRNTEGSGIGLFLVKSIVDLHRGKISVESEVGKGSIFKVELPVRTIEQSKDIEYTKPMSNKVEMIHIEFSDIYNL